MRSLRVQDAEASRGQAGDRCALNIVGAQDVQRGNTLSTIGSLPCSTHIDARFRLLQGAPFPLKHLSPVKLYLGTRRLACKIYFIEPDSRGPLMAGDSALVQLILEDPVVCCSGDNFLIRDDSENVTLGGGMVLDPFAPKTGKSRQHRLDFLAAIELPSLEKTLAALLRPGLPPLNISQLRKSWNLAPGEWDGLLEAMPAMQFESQSTQFALSKKDWCTAEQFVLEQVQQWHETNPQSSGMGVLELQTSFMGPGDGESRKSLFKAVISTLIRGGSLNLAGGLIKSASYKLALSAVEETHWTEIEKVLGEHGMIIPTLSEIALSTGLEQGEVRAAVQAAVRLNLVHKINDNRCGLSDDLLRHATIVSELGQGDERITVVNFKNRIATGRKLAIEILEYFDTLRFTQRRGDRREVIDETKPGEVFGSEHD